MKVNIDNYDWPSFELYDINLVQKEVGGGIISKEQIDCIRNFPNAESIIISGLKQDTFDYFVSNYGNQFRAISFWKNKLVNDLLNADKKAVSYINDTLPNIYATNINYETFNAEKETLIDTSFTLYNEDTVRKLIKENPQLLPINPNLNVPKDLRWNKRHINSAITQGILQGEGIPKIAKRLERAANMDKSAAIRNARTCVTSAQNAGRLDAMKRERDMGIAIKKVWLATLDSRTRDSHVALDGEERELEEKFSNGLIAPANDGGEGEPEQCYNCRCRLGRQFDKYKTDWTNLENRQHDELGNMSYEQWKEEHRKHADEVAE